MTDVAVDFDPIAVEEVDESAAATVQVTAGDEPTDSEHDDTSSADGSFGSVLKSVGDAIRKRHDTTNNTPAGGGGLVEQLVKTAGPALLKTAPQLLDKVATAATTTAAPTRASGARPANRLELLLAFLDGHDFDYTMQTSRPASSDDHLTISLHRVSGR